MPEQKKRIMTFIVLISAAILILLGILYLITKSFAVDAMLHIFVRLISVPIAVLIIKKSFKDQLADSMNKVLIWCGCIIATDLVIVDAIRYILSSGTSIIFFLPSCLPICFMIVMSNSVLDAGVDKSEIKRLAYLVGIPLLLLTLYFEVLSFLQIA